MRLSLVLSVVLLFGQSQVRAAEQQEVLWLVSDYKPFMIAEGPMAGEGYLDKAQQLFQQMLPFYTHRLFKGNVSRREQVMQRAVREGRQVCSVTLFRTPKREAFLSFSRPYLLVLPSGLITLQSQVERFAPYRDAAGNLQLAQILAARELRLGATQARVYGGAIDAVLQSAAASAAPPSIIWRAGEDNSEGLYAMLQRGRIDFTLGFAVEEQYLQRLQAGQQPSVFLPLLESVELQAAAFSCARTPWGERTVAQLDAVLADPARRAQFQSFYEAWLSPETLQLYRARLAAYEAALKAAAQP